MDERKVTNHWHFGDLGANALMVIILLGMGLTVLVIMAIKGNVPAIVILSVLVAVSLITFGVFLSLVISAQVHKRERERAEVEQIRFRDNTTENLAHLEQQARVQLAQAKAQDQQWRVMRGEVDAWRKMIPAGNNEMVPGGFDFSDIDFAELED